MSCSHPFGRGERRLSYSSLNYPWLCSPQATSRLREPWAKAEGRRGRRDAQDTERSLPVCWWYVLAGSENGAESGWEARLGGHKGSSKKGSLEKKKEKNCCCFATSSTEMTLNVLAAHSNCGLSLQIQICVQWGWKQHLSGVCIPGSSFIFFPHQSPLLKVPSSTKSTAENGRANRLTTLEKQPVFPTCEPSGTALPSLLYIISEILRDLLCVHWSESPSCFLQGLWCKRILVLSFVLGAPGKTGIIG